MDREFQPIAEWRDVTFELFRDEIFAQHRPAILRGLVAHWPAAQAGLRSPQAFFDYVKRFDGGAQVGVLIAPPALKGRFFYTEDMRRANFERRVEVFAAAMGRLLQTLNDADPPAVYIESVPLSHCLPDFARENVLDLVNPAIGGRIWLGNRVRTQTHYDLQDNIACVVAGRRRFTLFPPDQLPNLYMGPLELTVSGTPCSMVSLEEPDLERYPRFEKALEAAQSAVLEPGDAIYIPYSWWHHVQSLEPFNGLVNYWWNDAPPGMAKLYDSLLHGVLAIRDLPDDQRAAWRVFFDYFVFKTSGEPMAHLPPHVRGALGPLTPEQRSNLMQALLKAVQNAIARS